MSILLKFKHWQIFCISLAQAKEGMCKKLKPMKLNTILLISIMIFASCSGEKKEKNLDGSLTFKANKSGRISAMCSYNIKNPKAERLYLKALELERNEHFHEASESLVNANEIEPNNVDILNLIALLEMRLHNFNSSEKHFKDVISLNNSYRAAYINLGLLYYYSHKYESGVAILKSMNYKKANITMISANYFHLFMNYTGLHNCDSAYHYYLKVKEINSNNLVDENIERFKQNDFDVLNCK